VQVEGEFTCPMDPARLRTITGCSAATTAAGAIRTSNPLY
jgi:hypothetical protein